MPRSCGLLKMENVEQREDIFHVNFRVPFKFVALTPM